MSILKVEEISQFLNPPVSQITNNLMTTSPQSEVKCCEKCCDIIDGGKTAACAYCPCHKESPVSQSVEGYVERLAMAITHSEQGEYTKNEAFVREIIRTLLSTLVKEMEGLCGEDKIGDNGVPYRSVKSDEFCAGISAAIEVVNRLNK